MQVRGVDEYYDQDVVIYIAGINGIDNKADGFGPLIILYVWNNRIHRKKRSLSHYYKGFREARI